MRLSTSLQNNPREVEAWEELAAMRLSTSLQNNPREVED
jgi:hypothetical protein